MVKLLCWWIQRQPIARQRRTVECMLRACGLPRRYALQVSAQVGAEARRDAKE